MKQATYKCFRCGEEDNFSITDNYYDTLGLEVVRICNSCKEEGTVYSFIEMSDMLNELHIHGYPVSVIERREGDFLL